MRISMRGDYGIRAVVDLAQHYGEGPVQSGEIARRQGIPEPYLDQLLATLRKARLVASVRGPQGGHALVRHPSELTLGDVLAALEGSFAPLRCVEEESACQLAGHCAAREVWQRVQETTQSVLNSVTVEELAKRQAGYDSRVMYYI